MRSKIHIGQIIIGIIIGLLLSTAIGALAGNLEPSAPPTSTSSYSLGAIYDRLDAGAGGAPRTFTEPSRGPGDTMHTLNEIMAVAPATHTEAALPAHILSGKVAWGLSAGAWGVITGTGTLGGAGVSKTGQTTVYTVGDDGDLQKGIAWPSPRFTDNSDGTVTDNLTGLIWLKDANCIANQYSDFDNDDTAGDGGVTWQHALDFVAGINANAYPNCGASFNDWRLPNIRELHSLVHYGYYYPALPNTAGTGRWSEGDPFTGVQSNYYWSSTTDANGTSYAWGVYLNGGYVTTTMRRTATMCGPSVADNSCFDT